MFKNRDEAMSKIQEASCKVRVLSDSIPEMLEARGIDETTAVGIQYLLSGISDDLDKIYAGMQEGGKV